MADDNITQTVHLNIWCHRTCISCYLECKQFYEWNNNLFSVFILVNLTFVTRITLSFNKLSSIPPGIANLINLEILNLSNNHLEELPLSISSMPKLRILNCSINRLSTLPRGFGAFPVLEVLDLSYNNLNEKTLPGNFFMMGKCAMIFSGGKCYLLFKQYFRDTTSFVFGG